MYGGTLVIFILGITLCAIIYSKLKKPYTHTDAVVFMTLALLEIKQQGLTMTGTITYMPSLHRLSDLQTWLGKTYRGIDFWTPTWTCALIAFMQVCDRRVPVPKQLGDILLLAEYISTITPQETEEVVRRTYLQQLYDDYY
jgi:hypothetical protein